METGIPVLKVTGEGLPVAWEGSIAKLLMDGKDAPSQYDRPGDPLTKDCTMICETVNPLKEPMIHGFMPGGPGDLEEYCMEVLDGVKNHWLRNPDDPEDTRWSYTYHGRLCNDFGVNQVYEMCDKLKGQPFSRQVQATTWMPASDPNDYDPPCLQRLWCRILRNPETGKLEFTAHVFFRSRDALKAAFMNAFAFVRLFDEQIRRPVESYLGEEVIFAKFVDFSDSYHIYGKDFKDLVAFNKQVGHYYTYRGDWDGIMEEYRPEIMEKIAAQDKKHGG